ncbi:MAG: YegP family protein [Akkermansiaceae bacterium]|jgi:uncharacterized protein YegP (UPF0339 family)|nr:YegP family protein [Akkermansiaceae bacterium]
MKGYFELKKSTKGDFHFALHAGNHEPILNGPEFSEKIAAERAIAQVRTHGIHEARYERNISHSGEPYFVLKNSSGEILGTSDVYGSEASRDDGVRSVVANCISIIVKDLTA